MIKRTLAELRRRGYRLTPQRVAVLRVIAESSGHLTPADVYEIARIREPRIGLVTVYRTLGMLAGLGLICEVHGEEGRRGYLLTRPHGHHHHLICSSCTRVVDFTGCRLTGLEERLRLETGFTIKSHTLEFLGCCPDCQREAAA